MSVLCDLHLHTSFSSDSDTPMIRMVQRALELGLKTICFTEHMDYDYPANPEGLTFHVDMDAYIRELSRLKELFGDRIEILFGLELGMQPHLAPRYAQLAESCPFDYLIASQHLVDGLDPYERSFWEGRREAEVYRQYFSEMYENLQKMTAGADFDTAAHLDYIVRYGPDRNLYYHYETYAEYIDPILQLLIRRDKCLEVNTAGLKYGLGHTNPAGEVLSRYYELGGRLITLGSDAHQPGHMAWEFDRASRMLTGIGFRSVFIYRGRKACEVPLCG